MQHQITVELPTEVYQPLYELALREGRTIEEWVAQRLARSVATQRSNQLDEAARQLAEERFARHFGAVRSGDARAADNEKIDADLARAYAATHDDE